MEINADLLKERNKCDFDIEEVTHIIDGGKANTIQRRKIEDISLNSGASIDEVPDECLGPKERYENAVGKSCLLSKIVKEELLGVTGLEDLGANSPVLRRIADAFFKEVSPFLLHFGMFVPTILGQCTLEQQSHWLPFALDMQIIGTYAQTELGHGTFIRGLETTATYDPENEQFVFHSPTLSSYKWWAGGLGKTANHCIVVAQLYTKGKCHGPHPFIVQIRNLDTHIPLKGIKLGEIGPRLGFNTADNGFLGFNHYRVPREKMMMKYAKVLKDSTYVKVARHGKLTYGTMVFVRVMLVNEMAFNLAKASTIAVRYSAVRRQSQPKPNEPEPQVLDYLTQQHKLFICIATSHALQSNRWLWSSFTAVLADMRDGNTDKLPELHALSSCLKAVSTSDCSALIEQCRFACGGHGYMISSNLPLIYGFVAATRTYEGDYTVLLLQTARLSFRDSILWYVFKDNSPFGLHHAMFMPAILGQADDKQKEFWLKKAENLEIIGTYAQTELGHGTFIRGLETTATYDASTEEFVLHSPTLTAYKWWPGNLGHTANHCIVMAQHFINGKKHGIQPFMVQLRHEETHMPLPGIKVGEIGVKLGFNTVNNGFLGFEHHRIPRDRMLMKNAQVLRDGTFIPSRNNKLTYGTMVFVRVTIVFGSAKLIARAATVAIRYSAVRRQSQLRPDEAESQILDYVSQQHKLFIGVASYYAFSLTAMWLWDIFEKYTSDLAVGKLDLLPELHALSCCLKALSSGDCSAMVERCRQACGGHGYLMSSSLPLIYGLVTAACTYEGENTVMLLQTARYLAKAWNQARKGNALPKTMAYIVDNTTMKHWDNSLNCITEGFQRVAAGKLSTSITNLEKYQKEGTCYEDAWNKTSVQLIAAAESHGRAVILSVFKVEMERTSKSLSEPLQQVLRQLIELYFYYWTFEKLGDLLLFTPITGKDVEVLKRRYEDLLEAMRPNAVGLVDAFDYRDEILSSTLGAYDGRVYERLMAEALKSPLNSEPVNRSFHRYLKPFMQGKL